jgi:hypothetical protein
VPAGDPPNRARIVARIRGGAVLRGVHHAGITVSNLDRALAFYVRDPDGYTVELFQPPPEQ